MSFRSEKVGFLVDFPIDGTGTIVSIDTDNDLQSRLMGLGLFVGIRFRLLQGGNASPLILAVGDTRIVLGHELGRRIQVE